MSVINKALKKLEKERRDHTDKNEYLLYLKKNETGQGKFLNKKALFLLIITCAASVFFMISNGARKERDKLPADQPQTVKRKDLQSAVIKKEKEKITGQKVQVAGNLKNKKSQKKIGPVIVKKDQKMNGRNLKSISSSVKDKLGNSLVRKKAQKGEVIIRKKFNPKLPKVIIDKNAIKPFSTKKTVTKEIDKGQNKSAEDFFNEGLMLSDKGSIDKAISSFLKSIELKPGFFEAENNIGNLYLKKGWLEKAAERYRKVIKLSPNYVKGYNNLGNVYLQLGLIDPGIKQFEKAVSLNDTYYTGYYNMGCAYAKKKDNKRAIEFLKKAISLNKECRNWAKGDPDLKTLKTDNEFIKLIFQYK